MYRTKVLHLIGKQFVIAILLILLLLTTGCTLVAPEPTATPVPTEIPTDTPEPTVTNTPTPTETPIPTATPDRTATASVLATETMTARLAELAPELESIGFSSDSGKLVYDKNVGIAMTVKSYNSYWPETVTNLALKDFILHVDVQWDSTSGLAGCGIMFRAEEDLERGSQYIFELMRLSGAPHWAMFYRKFNTTQTFILEPRPDTIIDDNPRSTNTVVLVVQGDLLQAYINGKKMREGRFAKLSEGGVAFLTWQESGDTTCVFNNIWIWELNPPTAE